VAHHNKNPFKCEIKRVYGVKCQPIDAKGFEDKISLDRFYWNSKVKRLSIYALLNAVLKK
jgi:hypothetical protein